MKIELKNVKHSKFASQETDCFEASIYIDGKKEGTVSNQGCGGCNMYYPNSLGEKLTAYAKTLPPVDVSYLYNDGKVHTMQEDADTLIGSIFEKHLLKKDCARKTLFKVPSYAYKSKGEFHVMNVKFSAEIKAELVKQYGKDVEILNEEFVKV